MDLHLHTPASTDYQQAGVSALDILRKAEERGLDIISFTDHNSVRGYADLWREIEDLELLEFLNRMTPAEAERLAEFRRLLGKILLLPGFEFTATFGFHVLAIFPETTSIRLMEHLLLSLGVAEDRFGSGEVGATSDVLKAYEVLDQHGALVIGAHVNSSHGVAMQGIRFGGQTKIAYTQDERLHALEVTDLGSTSRRSTAVFFSGIKAEYPRRMHCIQGSDAHRLERDPNRDSNLGIGDRATEVQLSEATFGALKALFKTDRFDRVRPARPGGPLADALHEARDAGNTQTQAFHERLSTARAGNAAILRDVAALANSNGGVVYVGVGPSDKRTVPGVGDAAATVAGLQAEIAAEISPAMEISMDVIDYGGKNVVAIHVPDGSDKPYALGGASIHVRRGGETAVAHRDEIVAMVRGVPRHPVAEPAEPPAPQQISSAPSPGAEDDRRRDESPRRRRGTRPTPDGTAAAAAPVMVADLANSNGASGRSSYTEDGPLDDIAPRTGAEVVSAEDENGIRYYAIRDLRNGAVTYNVTRESARRLWQYAIQQREERPAGEGHIRWKGDFGFWKVYRPIRGERRFNLAYRGEDEIRMFYGVSEEGLDDDWKAVLPVARSRED